MQGCLTAVYDSVAGVRRGNDLEMAEECVWVDISTSDGFNLLIDNYHFKPEETADTLEANSHIPCHVAKE